jgi:hypothetical protein
MSRKRIKSKAPRRPVTYPVDESDALATWHVKHEWGKEQVASFTAMIHKFCFILNGRILARATRDGFIIMGAFLDEKSRDAAMANVRSSGDNAAMLECPVPETRGQGFGPLAGAAPSYVFSTVVAAMSSPDAIEAMEDFTADRMEITDGTEDFVFPDLSPERYEAVMQRRRRKPQ